MGDEAAGAERLLFRTVLKEHSAIGAVAGVQFRGDQGNGRCRGGGRKTAIYELRHGGLPALLISIGGTEVGKRVDGVLIKKLQLDHVVAAGLLKNRFHYFVSGDG